jgi:AcrR family transcriptional regulator
MGRPKKFSRDGVLEKTIPVFWEHGFADTSLQDLELATGVNKSGLYAEFASKEDLFLASLRHYLEHREGGELLSATTLGWHNVEAFLRLCMRNIEAEKPATDAAAIADLVTVFFTGICTEQNLKGSKESFSRKVDNFMLAIQAL